MEENKKMTPKQKRFCDEYLIDLNATQAAIRAGYSRRTASSIGFENLNKPQIKEYIKARMAEKEKELIADQDEVLRYLTAVLRGEDLDERTFFTKEGPEPYGIKNQDNQMKAAELLGKRYGLWDKKQAEEPETPNDGFIDALRGGVDDAWQDG